MPIGEKLLAALVLLALAVVVWLMIASGIETWLRAKYEEREEMHRRKERHLRRNVMRLARAMYLNALASTRVNVFMKAAVIEDDLGKGCEKHV